LTYALIDNATLTGVQRITGEIQTRSRDSVDTDIIALENLIQAVLLYDRIVAVDNYKPEYRQNRINSFPYIQFLDAEALNLNEIEDSANEESEKLRPEIRGGEFVNEDFNAFFDTLKTHIICTWDVSSSIYYLTLKVLADNGSEEFKKYGNLAAGIFSELFDAKSLDGKPNNDVVLIDRFGNEIREGYKIPDAKWGDGSTGGLTAAIKAFVASLTWLANRSIYYSLASKYLKSDTFLYPIRQAYQQYYIGKSCNYGIDFTRHVINRMGKSLSEDLIAIHSSGLATATTIDLPIFSAWLARETGDVSTIIDSAFQIRDDSNIRQARDQLREIRRLFDEVDIAKANKAIQKIIADVSKISANIRIKYGISTPQGKPVTRLIQIYNTFGALTGLPRIPEYNFKIKLPDFLSNIHKRKETGFQSLYRDISSDLSRVWALGEARDILGNKVQIDKHAPSYSPKAESPKYQGYHSKFKSPM
jgi:hypothetical protein